MTKPHTSHTSEILTLPMVPLREMVVFPGMMIPFVVGRTASVAAVEAGLREGNRIFLVAQKNPEMENPSRGDMHSMGVVANVIQSVRLTTGNIKVLVEGERRAQTLNLDETAEGFRASLEAFEEPDDETGSEAAEEIHFLFKKYARLNTAVPQETLLSALKDKAWPAVLDAVAARLPSSTADKQAVLEALDVHERAEKVKSLLEREIGRLQMDEKINDNVKHQIERAQREYYLNEKMKAIRKELGRKADDATEIEELRKRVKAAGMPKEVQEKALKEIDRLEAMPPISAEATVTRNYLDWLTDMPWRKRSKEIWDINKAKEVLDRDHHGLKEIKERILEHLSVCQLVDRSKASILCLAGPPGVGKTSLAKSIAEATGRKFVRLSLGGVRDEADVRGHRRTYIGAYPGQIVQMLKKAGTRNPVFLLDELDKVGASYRGDPAAALVEVLDPEQNHTFVDHYLDVEFDLSEVMFIGTANVLHTIPPALRDRLEIIQLSGYTLNEKCRIALDHLANKQISRHGLKPAQLHITKEAIEALIEQYTREAGVRELERCIARICRKVARRVVSENREVSVEVTPENIHAFMGIPKYVPERLKKKLEAGVAQGLAWTATGGDVLTIEATLMEGRGHLRLTGKLGDVMRESAKAGLSYVRASLPRFALDKKFYDNTDIHIHVPSGAIPKDGPSAGITMAAALFSAVSGVPIRSDLAMTGEITLRGRVLPVGGIKEKVLAAHRYGIRTLVLPAENRKDEEDIPEEILKDMRIIYVEHMDEVLLHAMVEPLRALPVQADVAVPAAPQ
jgi:ATP-dependent Lon protease